MPNSDCRQLPLSPALPPEPGIVLTLAPRPLPLSPLVVHGSFLLSQEQSDALDGGIHRAVVLVVQHGSLHNALTPFRDRVIFADDVTPGTAGMAGYFSLDVFELQGGFAAGHYHLLVSIGEQVSAVVETYVQ